MHARANDVGPVSPFFSPLKGNRIEKALGIEMDVQRKTKQKRKIQRVQQFFVRFLVPFVKNRRLKVVKTQP